MTKADRADTAGTWSETVNCHVNAIAGRPPQRRSLEVLHRIMEITPPGKGADVAAKLATIRGEFPSVTDFERDFPSLCFALATGVGKTRLMGAFISYLHQAHGTDNFFVLAPNLTIYNKLITDFTPNTPKYVFRGIAEFATEPPMVITGDNYEQQNVTGGRLFGAVRINIFNISKINSEVRGGKAPRIKRLSEYIGASYFDYLAGLPDLVLLMDESHRYRASAGIRAINELKPILGLELTATPFVETSKGTLPFKNVIVDYPLGRAMADGFVKEPAVVTRKDFDPSGMSAQEIERLKLEDGVRLHEGVKVELETYARESDKPIVKPFVLVIARDTTHASQLKALIQSDAFFEGRYRDKVLQVDSSKTGVDEERMIADLLKVEHADDPTEIVIHVNMLKEGWDVTNLYTIVPLRAANARVLIEQSIGRGLRLPYGVRTGVTTVDRLNIVAHDRFQEIVDEAKRPGSTIRLQTVVLDMDQVGQKTATMVSQSQLATQLGFKPATPTSSTQVAGRDQPAAFDKPQEQALAQLAYAAIQKLSGDPQTVPTVEHLRAPEVQAAIVAAVEESRTPAQLELVGLAEEPDIAAFIHAQMQQHWFEEAAGYEVKISKGFTELKPSAYSYAVAEPPADYWISPQDKSNMGRYLFGGFQRYLYPVQKFESDAERKLAVILEREAQKWFRPAKGQFQIYYRDGANHREYQPDFVAETDTTIYMLEPKMRKEMADAVVLTKKAVAVSWCANASTHALAHGGKPWRYLLIPHDAIAENMTLVGLAKQFWTLP